MNEHSYWYMGLSLISLIILAYSIVKKKTAQSLFQFLIMVQLGYIIETVIYIFGGSYEYHPKLLKNSSYFDSNMGALTSNMLILPSLATYISVFRVRWLWIVVIIGLIACVEMLFVKLQIYTLRWWRIEYTSLGLVFYFALAKKVYPLLVKSPQGWMHSLLLFLATAPILGTLHIVPIMLFMNRLYSPGWYTDVARDTTAFSSIYYLCATFIIVVFVKLQRVQRWMKLAALVIVFGLITVFLSMFGILKSHVWWDPWYYVCFPMLAFLMCESISKRLKKGPRAE